MIRDLVLASGGSSNIGFDWTYQADMAVEWAKNPAASYGTLNYPTSIAWSGTQFCATGSEGSCATSPDGVNWTQQPGLRSCGLNSYGYSRVCWGGGKFCVVGAGVGSSNCATSTDGVTWTLGPGASDNSYYLSPSEMIWSGSKFCVVGKDIEQGGGFIATSPNGVNWAYQRFGIDTVTSVAWTGTYFCAVYGGDVTTTTSDVAVAYISYDGTSWQPYRLPDDYPMSIAWSGTQFCLISNQSTGQDRAHTSPDGHTWTLQPGYSSTPSRFSNIQWIGNQFVTCGLDGTFKTSPDGVTWTSQPAIAWGQHGYSADMAWSGSRLCVVGAAYQNYPEGIFGAAITSP